MDVTQKFWYAFYAYLVIWVVIIVVSIKFKYSQEKLLKVIRIPTVLWIICVFIWVAGFPLWLGVICSIFASVGFWLLLPNYAGNMRKAGEFIGKALINKKHNDDNDKTGSDS